MTTHPSIQPDSALEREIEQILFGRIMNARLEGYTVETARQIMELIAVHRGSGVQIECEAERALAKWAREIADGKGFYDPREADDLAEELVAGTPIVARLSSPLSSAMSGGDDAGNV